MTFTPKHSAAWRYWECSIAASREKTVEERAAIGAHFTDPDPVMIPKVQCGYYRLRRGQKGERRVVPVAVWGRGGGGGGQSAGRGGGGAVVLKIGGEMQANVAAFWERNCAWIEPVSYDDYQYAEENGQWPGDIQETAPRLGDNLDDGGAASGPQFRDQLIDLVGKVEAYIAREVGPVVADRVVADTLANYREMLGLAKKGAEVALKEEVAQIKLVIEDRKELWRPSIEAGDGAVEAIRTLLTPWMQAQAAEGLEVRIGGQKGRKMSPRTYWSAKITDWDKAMESYKNHPKVRALVQDLADAQARSKDKTPIAGVEFISEGRAA